MTTHQTIEELINQKFDPISQKINTLERNLIKNIDINKITESFIDTISNIYEYISLYYTYYKLNLNGVKDFEYEYRTLETKLYDDLYYTNLYMLISLIKEFTGKFKFYDNTTNRLTTLNNTKNNPEKYKLLLQTLDDCIKDIDYAFIDNIIDLNKKFPYRGEFDTSDKIIKISNYVESKHKWISNPQIFLNKSKEFIKPSKKIGISSTDYLCYGYHLGTSIETGIDLKDIYYRIYEYLKLYKDDETSKTLFVDAGFSMIHTGDPLITSVFFKQINDNPKTNQFQEITHYGTHIFLLNDVREDDYSKLYEIAKIANPRLQTFKYRTIILNK